ncbi:MAG: nitrous oxide-stimulated promoter family protein [Anaerolineaceae bacterium]|nr:nitrous oxide-stimulated promoter family protein [Anaerolineaceae bacterium]
MPGEMKPGNREGRLVREARTIQALVRIYCRDVHSRPEGVCPDCQALIDYAQARLERCPFHVEKPTCTNCTVHCYQPAMRERVRIVMRYAGPRMLFRHPFLSLQHLWDAQRRPPIRKRRKTI